MDERPLYVQVAEALGCPQHVRVAEALGWRELKPCGDIAAPWASSWDGLPPGAVVIVGRPEEGRQKVPRFDIDWSSTGPLIERLRLDVSPIGTQWAATAELEHATASGWGQATGGTPLTAVCNLLLALAKAGKLVIK